MLVKQLGDKPDLKFLKKIEEVHKNSVRFEDQTTAGKSNISEINEWISIKDHIPDEEVIALNDSETLLTGYIHGDNGMYVCENENSLLEDLKFWRPLPFTHRERKTIFNDF